MKIYLGGSFCSTWWRGIVQDALSDRHEYVVPTVDNPVTSELKSCQIHIHGHVPNDMDIMQFIYLEKESAVRMGMGMRDKLPKLIFVQFTYDIDNLVKDVFVQSVTQFGEYIRDTFLTPFVRITASTSAVDIRDTLMGHI